MSVFHTAATEARERNNQAEPKIRSRRAAGELAANTRERARQACIQEGSHVEDVMAMLPDAALAVDRSHLPELLNRMLKGSRGTHRSLPWRTLLIGMVVNAMCERIATLANVQATLLSIARHSNATAVEYGLVRQGPRWNGALVTYRMIEDAYNTLTDALDDSGIPDIDPATGEILGPPVTLGRFCDMLLDGTVPDDIDVTTGHWAVDGTMYESWGRKCSTGTREAVTAFVNGDTTAPVGTYRDGYPKLGPDGRPQHTTDPDAREGHLPAKNMEEAKSFNGYDIELAVATRPHHPSRRIGQPDVPDLPLFVRSMRVVPAGFNTGVAGRMLLESLDDRGLPIESVQADMIYNGALTEVWADVIRHRFNADYITKLRAEQYRVIVRWTGGLEPREVLEVDGGFFTNALPTGLRELPHYGYNLTTLDKIALAAEYDKRLPYAFAPMEKVREDGSQRYRGPALTGRIRCPNTPRSMRGSASIPLASCVRGDECSCGSTITVLADWAPRIRQPRLFGTSEWNSDVNRRVQVESFNGLLFGQDQRMDRGYIRMFGLAKNTVLIAAAVAATNLKRLKRWRQLKAAIERIHTANGTRAHRRRSRARSNVHVRDVSPDEDPRTPIGAPDTG